MKSSRTRGRAGRWICTAERYDVRQSGKRNTYTGKTYNSLENISQFFAERGMSQRSNRACSRPRPPQTPRRRVRSRSPAAERR